MNLVQLAAFTQTQEEALNWCFERQLLPRTKNCPQCHNPMTFSTRGTGIGKFRCRRQAAHRHRKDVSIGIAVGTWFENAHLPLNKVLLICYAFVRRFTYEQTRHEIRLSREDTVLSDNTIADWFAYCPYE